MYVLNTTALKVEVPYPTHGGKYDDTQQKHIWNIRGVNLECAMASYMQVNPDCQGSIKMQKTDYYRNNCYPCEGNAFLIHAYA